MNCIRGDLKHRKGRISAIFSIRSYVYSFQGTISPGLPDFDQEVKLSYNNIQQMKGRGKITGEISANTFFITLPNEVVMSGTPLSAIKGVFQISGKVSWLEI